MIGEPRLELCCVLAGQLSAPQSAAHLTEDLFAGGAHVAFFFSRSCQSS
jgi:hypothetical protein